MVWTLAIIGAIFVAVGAIVGGVRPVRPAREPRPGGDGTAWEVITRPLEQPEELIKIPNLRPWYRAGGDPRFARGLIIGLGTGLLLSAGSLLIAPQLGFLGLQPPSPSLGIPPAPEPATGITPSPVPGVSPPSVSQPSSPPTSSASTPPASPPTAASAQPITITEGETAPAVASKLKQAGLIADENTFLNRLVERGDDRKIRPGTFRLAPGATVDAVIDALIR